ncbi:MAG: 2-dehydro-3-deoxygalactonokinase [Alphaproteobacteria bacterium]|nr:2-dehydro-3-deoxygalactonokinase [Alphaproteobacteria bacterium]
MAGVAARLIADWGTTHLRAWTLDADGAVVGRLTLARGVSGLAPGEAEAVFRQEIQPALRAAGLPALLCGMVGSNLGWTPVAYLACPVGAREIAANLCEVAPDVRITPGLRTSGVLTGAPDVMRGEETQILGWMADDPARTRGRHFLCLPGTHAKWVQVEEGRIISFVTAMTGELYALLMRHSVLRGDPADAEDDAAFCAGLEAAGDGGALAARLFSARARVVAGGAPARETSAYVSGLLIGAEVAAAPALLGETPHTVHLLGEPALCKRYAAALARNGAACQIHDGEAAVIAGLGSISILSQKGDAP